MADPSSEHYKSNDFTIIGGFGSFSTADQSGDNNLDRDVYRGSFGIRYNFPIGDSFRGNFTGEFQQDIFEQLDGYIVDNQSWATGLVYYHNGEGSAIGAEGGFRYHANDNGGQTVGKFGGFGRVRANEVVAFDAFGGALFPGSDEGNLKTSFYAGGDLTGYLTDNVSFSGFMDWSKDRLDLPGDYQIHSLRAGGRAEYLCLSVPGIRTWGSVAYTESWQQINGSKTWTFDGIEFLVGVSFDMFSDGDQPTSLVNYDDHLFNTSVYSLPRPSVSF